MCSHEFVKSFPAHISESFEDSLAVVPHKILSTVSQQTENIIGLGTDGIINSLHDSIN